MAKPGDAINISSYLVTNESKNQVVYTEYKYLKSIIKYYYKGSNTISFLMEYNNIDNLDSLHSLYNSTLEKWEKRGQVWYVSDCNDKDKYLRQKMKTNFSIEKEKDFYGGRKVFLLKKKDS